MCELHLDYQDSTCVCCVYSKSRRRVLRSIHQSQISHCDVWGFHFRRNRLSFSQHVYLQYRSLAQAVYDEFPSPSLIWRGHRKRLRSEYICYIAGELGRFKCHKLTFRFNVYKSNKVRRWNDDFTSSAELRRRNLFCFEFCCRLDADCGALSKQINIYLSFLPTCGAASRK